MNPTPDKLKMEPDILKMKEIKPTLAGYIRKSQALLKTSAVPDEKTVHDVRVLMKKARAALKLAGYQLDKYYFDRDIHALREVGRIMRLWREICVQRQILKELKKEYPAIFSKLKENEKLTNLLKKADPYPELSPEMKTGLDLINELLFKTGYRIRFQTMNTNDPQLLIKELELTYKSVVDIYIRCRNNPKPDIIHEFRKKAKDFLYQLCFFKPYNPVAVKSVMRSVDNMADNLGKFNDLTMLVNSLGYKWNDGGNLPAMDELIIKIRGKQDRYLARVWLVAYKVFCPGKELVKILGFKDVAV
jgi:CHAD domain-containing protein